MSPHFFGDSNHPLFGVYHPARARGTRRPAVLLCPPIGHEYLRTHWALRMLASKLARQGHPVMRFDYRGIGDSAGTLTGVHSLQVWVEDVSTGARDLLDESASDSLVIVGLRFGAALASLAVADGLQVQHAVLWEPSWSGEEYLADLRAMHAAMLDLWVCPMTTENSGDCEEILGSMYARALLGDIQQFDLAATFGRIDGRPTIVEHAGPLRAAGAMNRVLHDDPTDWADLQAIETAWLPTASTQLIVGALQAQPPPPGSGCASGANGSLPILTSMPVNVID